MNTDDYLLNLIERMLDRTLEDVPEAGGSMYVVSDQAYKEAATLANPKFIQPLQQIIEQYSSNKAQDKAVRRKSYYILEQLAINTDHREIFDYFADRLAKETDKDILGDGLLFYLNRNEYIPNLSKIVVLVEDNRWQVRDMVIKMLGNYPKEEVESLLLDKLKNAKDQYEISALLGSLRKIHSTNVLEMIETFLHHEKGDVRSSALATVKVVGGKKFLPIYIQALKDRSRDVKLNALYAVLEHGDESVIGILIERLKTIVKTKRKLKPGTVKGSDVVNILQFILQFKNNKEVATALDWIVKNKWNHLFENEQEWIKSNT
ncbi:HEAT repeat domain-containing protein [Anaerobacillus sp. MEB173]|uniref:HEAT repeat domain-containing protein n=1 Tax=Anaerobacillus sp. MEB173 TaxID=3383345 RepID=UPI003F8DF0BE